MTQTQFHSPSSPSPPRLLSLDQSDSYEKMEEKYFQKKLTILRERALAGGNGEGRGGGTVPYIYEGGSEIISEEVKEKYGNFPVKFQVRMLVLFFFRKSRFSLKNNHNPIVCQPRIHYKYPCKQCNDSWRGYQRCFRKSL